MKAGANDAGVVENHQFPFRHVVRKVEESVFGDFALTIYQEFGAVPLRQRIFGDAFIGKRIGIVRDAYVLRRFHSEAYIYNMEYECVEELVTVLRRLPKR